MAIEITGRLHTLFDVKHVTDKFSKREFVIETLDEKYPQTLLLQAAGKKISILDGYKVGDEIKVSINLNGREYKDKKTGEPRFFNSIDAWRIEKLSESKASEPPPAEDIPSDDIPF